METHRNRRLRGADAGWPSALTAAAASSRSSCAETDLAVAPTRVAAVESMYSAPRNSPIPLFGILMDPIGGRCPMNREGVSSERVRFMFHRLRKMPRARRIPSQHIAAE